MMRPEPAKIMIRKANKTIPDECPSRRYKVPSPPWLLVLVRPKAPARESPSLVLTSCILFPNTSCSRPLRSAFSKLRIGKSGNGVQQNELP